MVAIDSLKTGFEKSSEQLVDKISDWGNTLFLQLPNLVLAIIIFFISLIAMSFLKKGIRKVVSRYSNNKTIVHLSTNVTAVIFSIIVGLIILSIFNLNGAVNKFLATAGVIGLAIGLALQDPLQNLFSGVLMSVRNLYNVGDIVETNGFFGTITNISLRSTLLNTPQGQKVTIPNKDVIQKPLINYSYTGKRRLDLSCGVSYAENLERVKEITLKAIENLEGLLNEQPIRFYYTEFADSSINYVLQIWTSYNTQADFNQFKSNAIMAIKKAYDRNDISIPFPIRTLDFGIKGGANLSEILNNGKINKIDFSNS